MTMWTQKVDTKNTTITYTKTQIRQKKMIKITLTEAAKTKK